jgi:hypothetical protein
VVIVDTFKRINDYYHIHENVGKMLSSNVNGEKKVIPLNENYLFFTFGNKVDKINIEKEVEIGNIIKIRGIDLYKNFYKWDEETCLKKAYGYDKRTFAYLNKIKENTGFIEEKHGYDEEKIISSQNVFVWFNASEVEIGQTKEGQWCAQFSKQTDIDDYDITRLYFSKKPSVKTILTITTLSSLEFDFKYNRIKESFNCWECGREMHWLDVQGDFSEKVEHLKERFCGHCD